MAHIRHKPTCKTILVGAVIMPFGSHSNLSQKQHEVGCLRLVREWFRSLHIDTFEPPLDKNNKVTVRPAKTQISLGIRPVWSKSLLCAQSVAKDPRFLHADSEYSDQTGRMPRLICVFAGRTVTLLVLLWGGSFQEIFYLWLQSKSTRILSWLWRLLVTEVA